MGRRGAIALLLAAATVAVFLPLRNAGFVNYDDPGYVYENPVVAQGLSPGAVAWAFGSFAKANWHPLTWLSHMLDVELFGLDPGAHHLTSVLLHALCTALVFGFFAWTTGRDGPSALVAALFALHPLHVESVAWISERKDVLSTAFFWATLCAYVAWVHRGGAGRYALVALLLAAGLMAKPMLVTLPCVLLLLDFWPLGRVQVKSSARLVVEKLPLFALVGLASVVTLAAQGAAGAVIDAPRLQVGTRLANAATGYLWYVEKLFWPSHLAVLYPHPALVGASGPGLAHVALVVAVLAGVSGIAMQQARRRPYLLFGWLWFVGMLVPVIGLVQVGQQAVADRYGYLPLVGLFVMLAWLGAEVAARGAAARAAVVVASLIALVACAAASRAQLRHWQDARSLAEHAVAVTEGNFVMHYNLAIALETEGDTEAAIVHYREAIELLPGRPDFHGRLAAALARSGRAGEAARELRRAIDVAPGEAEAYNNLAWLLATSPDPTVRDGREARRLAEEALRLGDPRDPQLLDTLSAAQAESGDFRAAQRNALRGAALARQAGDAALAAAIEERAQIYRVRRPYRDESAGDVRG
ncbi:MAG: tetratricopeptide repeat protein [Deltaproteobacteria bacterium]|nr:tetratricopeptide repeat protein [Deltaproteobacteria bacterium]